MISFLNASCINFVLTEKTSVAKTVPVSLSANGSLSSPAVNVLHSKASEERPQNERSLASCSASTQVTRRDKEGDEEGEVFTSVPSNSFTRVGSQGEYELKAWPRKGGRFRSVVDTVRSLRCSMVPSVPSAFPGGENISGPEESAEQRNTSSVKGNSIRKKFSFLKDRRQRSVSESHLGVLYSSQDDLDPLLRRENGMATNSSKTGAAKKLVRRSSENITGSTTLRRQRSSEKYFHSVPNSPVNVTSSRDRSKGSVGQRNSRSTASCSSNYSSTTQEKCPMCDFNVLVLSECPDCKASQQDISNPSYQERLIL